MAVGADLFCRPELDHRNASEICFGAVYAATSGTHMGELVLLGAEIFDNSLCNPSWLHMCLLSSPVPARCRKLLRKSVTPCCLRVGTDFTLGSEQPHSYCDPWQLLCGVLQLHCISPT